MDTIIGQICDIFNHKVGSFSDKCCSEIADVDISVNLKNGDAINITFYLDKGHSVLIVETLGSDDGIRALVNESRV